ncbi:MAG: MmgE/PrpD family protein [Rhodospirillales bacterium CG15_BIG_FIL_POST_REV_8_21_14_020_66_15]|nr:MAG: MmgE/PrpD family protein [Rhodospirillales bacterium CG15_BIG_FIL_POST_REV_8_21_14_020_66_15]
MTGITRRLAEFAAGLTYDKLPAEVAARTKLLILDTAGIMVRARHDAESTDSLVRAVERLGLVSGNCSVLGDGRGYVPSAAALVNGSLAHSLDFDDTHAEASLHSSAPIVPAVLAAAEMTDASGKDVITACVVGYEIQIRLAKSLVPKDHYDRGYHPTATCGVMAASAAAGKILGLDADGIESALGIALSQAAGSMQFLADGAWTKRSHVGQAAQNGLTCATLAAEGFKGPKQAIEGKWGFLHSLSPNAQPDKATAGLGSYWETMALGVKPYPSCRYSHAALDAIRQLMTEHDIAADSVESATVGLPETGWKIIGDSDAVKQNPKSIVDGQFSMPFCAAVALRTGNMVWDDYRAHLKDAETLNLARRINTVVDPDAEAAFPDNMAGKATVRLKSGEVYERFVEIPKGEPKNFMDQAEFRAKFDGLCAPYMSQAGMEKFAGALLSLEEANSLRSVLALSHGDA